MDELCPYALSWGMSWELYWYGEMSAVLPYYEKWKIEQDAEQDKMDLQAWLNGIYVLKAVNALFSKQVEYPQRPSYLEKKANEEVPNEDKITREFLQLDDWRRAFIRNFRMDKERSE